MARFMANRDRNSRPEDSEASHTATCVKFHERRVIRGFITNYVMARAALNLEKTSKALRHTKYKFAWKVKNINRV